LESGRGTGGKKLEELAGVHGKEFGWVFPRAG
jgi:hypothetical protein